MHRTYSPRAISSRWSGCRLLICWPSEKQPDLVKILEQQTGLRISWINTKFDVESPEVFRDVDILITLGALPKSREHAMSLRYVHFLTAGFNWMNRSQLFMDPAIRWTSATGIHAPTVTEWVFMTYLAHEREYDDQRQKQRDATWDGFEFKAMRDHRSLRGQRVGILGYGSIGRNVARVANAFGMDVVAFTATPRETSCSHDQDRYHLPGSGDPDGSIPKMWYHGQKKSDIHEFLAQNLDLLVLAIPLTSETRHIIGLEEFQILRKHSPRGGAFISNVARGDVIVQDELIDALAAGTMGVRGAALDVQSPEPLPPDSPLWNAKNCFISPHTSSQDDQYLERGLEILIQNLCRPLEDKWLNEVVPSRGY